MKYLVLVIIGVLAWVGTLQAQNVTSSPLPIVLINVDGNATIPDEYKVCGTMKILYVNDSTTNYLSNQNVPAYIHYEGRVGIEKRGSTSQNLNKRHYGFETRQSDDSTSDNVSLLGMPAENDWVLNPFNYDNTYLRDPLSYEMARRTGHYATRTHYCEVFLGGNYRGIYTLTEKIKADKNRVNIHKIDTSENAMPNLTGGYIIKADKTTGGDPVAWSTSAHSYWENVDYIHHYPKPDNVTPAQSNYIQNYFAAFQAAMDSGDASVTTGYPSLIDIPSFVDYMIVAELTSNVDIYQKSTFFYKDQQGKLCAGPIWDFNCAFGSDPFASPGRSGYNVWQFDNGDNTGSEFWYQLFHDTQFHRLLCRRWQELTAPGAPLSYSAIEAVIDSLNGQIASLVARDKQRWGYYFNQSSAVSNLKTWLQYRYSWMNSQLTDTINSLPEVPNMVISKIHYHPHRTAGYAADSLEFIGITNMTDSAISLAGLYLSEPGLAFQLPPDAVADSAQEIYIAADTAAFRAVYGRPAYGPFTRDLSNSSQRIVLSDAWGRIIDDVTYRDRDGWPQEADGDGPFLLLTDLLSDNNIGANWSTDTLLWHVPVCLTPTDLIAFDVAYTSAQLSWVADSAQSLWQVVVMTDNSCDTLLADTAWLSLQVMPGSQYSVAVRAMCGEDFYSEWSDTITFFTPVCKSVTDIEVIPSCSSVLVSWTSYQDQGTWEVAYAVVENDQEGTWEVIETETASIVLHDLLPGKRYNLYVRAICDSAIYSDWSTPVTFDIFDPTIGISPVVEDMVLTVSPNPAADYASVSVLGLMGESEVSVIDMYGRVVLRQPMNDQRTVLALRHLAQGLYLVEVTHAQGTLVGRLMIGQ